MDTVTVLGASKYGCTRLMASGILEMIVFAAPYQAPTETIRLADLGPILTSNEQFRRFALLKDTTTGNYFAFTTNNIFSINGSTWATSTVGPWPAGVAQEVFLVPPVYIGSAAFAIILVHDARRIYKWNSVLNTIGGLSGDFIDSDTLDPTALNFNEISLMFLMPNTPDK